MGLKEAVWHIAVVCRPSCSASLLAHARGFLQLPRKSLSIKIKLFASLLAARPEDYDTYTRAIARHIGKHIPGNPTFVVENMTGAGSIIAANYVYKVAKPDGLTMCHFIGGTMLQQVLGKPGIEF